MSIERFLRLPTVEVMTGLKRAQLYAFARDGVFPRPIKIGQCASGWLESEVEDWIEARIRDSGGRP